tara:strand:- start:478 stop:651 length:174 start_codon:yes stop_codon:yes gene_type:complete
MGELELVESFPVWKALIWVLYPMAVLVLLEVVSSFNDNDDDDFGGGKMIPAYQGSNN